MTLPPLPPDPREGAPIEVPDLPHSWSTPYLFAIDSARALIILVSLYLIYLLAFTIFLSKDKGQRAVGTSFMLSVMVSTWTQFERVGRAVSWRLPVIAIMVFLGTYGIMRYMSGGHRLRDLTFKSWLIPPIPPPPVIPADIATRLRHSDSAVQDYRDERDKRIAGAAEDAAERVSDAADVAARATADDVEHAAKGVREDAAEAKDRVSTATDKAAQVAADDVEQAAQSTRDEDERLDEQSARDRKEK